MQFVSFKLIWERSVIATILIQDAIQILLTNCGIYKARQYCHRLVSLFLQVHDEGILNNIHNFIAKRYQEGIQMLQTLLFMKFIIYYSDLNHNFHLFLRDYLEKGFPSHLVHVLIAAFRIG